MDIRNRDFSCINPRNGGTARSGYDDRCPGSSAGVRRHSRDRRRASRIVRARLAAALDRLLRTGSY